MFQPCQNFDLQAPEIERRERSRVALAVLRLFDFTEGASRGVACLLGAHALRQVPVLKEL
jgi:hypothetical protein